MFRDRDWGMYGSFGGWAQHFATSVTSVFLGVVLAGIFLGILARSYLQYSVADSVQKINSQRK